METTTESATVIYHVNPETGLLESVSGDDDGADGDTVEVMVAETIETETDHHPQVDHVIGQEVEVVSLDPTKIPRPFLTTNKPSLLRRGPRTNTVPSHITAYPPQISQSVLSRFGQINNSSSTAVSPTVNYMSGVASFSSAATNPTASTIFYDRKTPLINTSRVNSNSINVRTSTLTVERARVNNRIPEEVIIWNPGDVEDVEVLEVDPAQLQQIFEQQSGQDQSEAIEEDDYQQVQIGTDSVIADEDGNIQQIVVYDGQNISELLQTYMLDVVNNPANTQGRRFHKGLKGPKEPTKRKLINELKCQEEGCEMFVHNVIDLRKHLQTHHDYQLDEELINFANDGEFKAWRTNYERDRKVSFIYRGGTKKISPEKAVTYLICHRSGVYKPTLGAEATRKRKMKPQGSCKIGMHCTAGVKLLKNLLTGGSEATVCHTHYGHELENLQHLRVNAAIKEIILQKFEEGMTFTEVLQYVHHNPDGLEGLRLVDRRAIRNIYDQWKKNKEPTVIKLENSFEDEGSEDSRAGMEHLTLSQFEEVQVHEEEVPIGKKKRISDSIEEPGCSNETSQITPDELETTIKIERTESLVQEPTSVLTTAATGATKLRPKRKKPVKPVHDGPVKSISVAVHEVVEKLIDHGESGPTVLFYKRSGNSIPLAGEETSLVKREDLCVVLQTPVQRQLLQMFAKILFVDVIAGNDIDIMVLAILDEFLTAIPVAWMITTEVTENMVELCFEYIKRNCVEVKCDYFYSHKAVYYHKLWSKAFGGKKPRLLFTQEDTIRDLANLARRHVENADLRAEITKLLETSVTTPDRKKFEDILKVLRVKSPTFLKALNKDWLLNKSQWAFHARLQVPYIIEESFARLKKFILFKGTKRLSKNIENILKIGYDRCFTRNKSLFKGDLKFQQTLDSIQANHNADHGAIIKIEKISDIKYLVEDEFEVFDLHTECTCKVRCELCGVCAHRFWCTCEQNLNFCSHAHQVCVFSKPNWQEKQEEQQIE